MQLAIIANAIYWSLTLFKFNITVFEDKAGVKNMNLTF